MMNRTRRPRGAAALTLAAVLTAMLALPAGAANQVTQTISAGSLSASIADVSLTSVSYSHSAQTSTGTMVLTADDKTGSGAGWNVTIQSSSFAHDGAGAAIPAANFSITSASGATATAGQAVDPVGGPNAPLTGSTGTLDTPRQTLEALIGFGQGTYTQDLGVNLDIPAQSAVGSYTGVMTVTINSGP